MPSSPPPSRSVSGFSASRVWTLATHTATQLLRMRILAFLAVFCLVVVGAATIFPQFSPEEQLKQLKDWSLGAMSLSSLVFATAATALLLPKDLEDRTLYTILSKPVPRYEYLLGKLLGVLLLIGAGLLIMDAVFSAVLWAKQEYLVHSTEEAYRAQQDATPENMSAIRASIAAYGHSWSIQAQVWMTFLRAAIITGMTLLISTFASTTLFTILASFALTVAGFGVELMREWVLKDVHGWTAKLIGGVLAIVCPDLSMFDLSAAVSRGLAVPWSVLLELTGYCGIYLVAYMVVSYLFFVEKEL